MKIIDEPQFDPGEEPDAAALDQLLSKARWPEPTVLAKQRLVSRWQIISRRHRVAPAIWSVAGAAAAAVLLMLGWMVHEHQLTSSSVQIVELPAEIDVKYLTNDGMPARPEDRVPSRPANILERLTLLQPKKPAADQPLAPIADSRMAEQQKTAVALLDRLTDAAEREPALAALQKMADPPVDQLLENLTSRNVDRRFAAARALAVLDNPRVFDALRELAENEKTRREALAALQWSINPQAKQLLAEIDLPSAARRQLDADEREFSIIKQPQPHS